MLNSSNIVHVGSIQGLYMCYALIIIIVLNPAVMLVVFV